MRVSQRYDFILEFSRIWTTATFLLNIRHAAIVWGITACLLISFNSGSAALGAVVRYWVVNHFIQILNLIQFYLTFSRILVAYWASSLGLLGQRQDSYWVLGRSGGTG